MRRRREINLEQLERLAEPLLLEGPLVGLVVRRVHALRDQIQSNMFVRPRDGQNVDRDRSFLPDAVDAANRLAERGEVEQGLEEDGPRRLRLIETDASSSHRRHEHRPIRGNRLVTLRARRRARERRRRNL